MLNYTEKWFIMVLKIVCSYLFTIPPSFIVKIKITWWSFWWHGSSPCHMFWTCSYQLGNCGQSLLNGIIGLGTHYGDVFLILILANQVIPTHSLKYAWIYICLHIITMHKGSSNIHVSNSLDSTVDKNLITLVVHPNAQYIVLLKK
jgi:hypothetical protein